MAENSEAIRRFREAVESRDMGALAGVMMEFAHDDFVQEWPQSGEQMRRDGALKAMEQYEDATGTRPTMQIRGIREAGDLAVLEGTIDYGNGVPVSYVGIAAFEDGKVRRMTEYFADPFEAPAWRAPFVERMAAPGDVT